jgi:signal transduction histidine kinase
VGNLLNNAAEYTPGQGRLELACTVNQDQFELCLRNTVNNLEPADLPMLFERFWRKDKARSDSEHTGLGLSLARSFAELLGYSLQASLDTQAGELNMTLKGPLRADSGQPRHSLPIN